MRSRPRQPLWNWCQDPTKNLYNIKITDQLPHCGICCFCTYHFFFFERVMFLVRILLRLGVLDTTLCDKVCQWLATGQWFSPGTPVSSTNKTVWMGCWCISSLSETVQLYWDYQAYWLRTATCRVRWVIDVYPHFHLYWDYQVYRVRKADSYNKLTGETLVSSSYI
jgi:hypothetical protein